MNWLKKLRLKISRFNNKPLTLNRCRRLIVILLLLAFGLILAGIRTYSYSPILALVFYPLLCLCVLFTTYMVIKKAIDLNNHSIIDNYYSLLNKHSEDREWLNHELATVQQLCYNKTSGAIHQRKKLAIEHFIHQLDMVAEKETATLVTATIQSAKEEITKELAQNLVEHETKLKNLEEKWTQEPVIFQQYINALDSPSQEKCVLENDTVKNGFTFIYKYIDDVLYGKFQAYELSYFKLCVLEGITNQRNNQEIENLITSINGIQRSDLGAFLHNLFVMCKYYNPPLRKGDFFANCQKYFEKATCDTAILSSNSTRIASGQKIFPIDMKKDNFFKTYLTELA